MYINSIPEIIISWMFTSKGISDIAKMKILMYSDVKFCTKWDEVIIKHNEQYHYKGPSTAACGPCSACW